MLSININVIGLKFTPGIRMLKGQKEKYLDGFVEYLSNVIQKELVRAIKTQRYKYQWKSLSPSYVAYKKSKGWPLKMWEATGLLKSSIIVYRQGSVITVGVSKNKRYSNGERVYDVIRSLEYGNTRIPARPLFRPLVSFIRKHINNYWHSYMNQGGLS